MEVLRSNMPYKFMDINVDNITFAKTKYTANKSKKLIMIKRKYYKMH